MVRKVAVNEHDARYRQWICKVQTVDIKQWLTYVACCISDVRADTVLTTKHIKLRGQGRARKKKRARLKKREK